MPFLFLLTAAVLPISAPAMTATALSSFEGIEEPLVRYAPQTDTFFDDGFANITDN